MNKYQLDQYEDMPVVVKVRKQAKKFVSKNGVKKHEAIRKARKNHIRNA